MCIIDAAIHLCGRVSNRVEVWPALHRLHIKPVNTHPASLRSAAVRISGREKIRATISPDQRLRQHSPMVRSAIKCRHRSGGQHIVLSHRQPPPLGQVVPKVASTNCSCNQIIDSGSSSSAIFSRCSNSAGPSASNFFRKRHKIGPNARDYPVAAARRKRAKHSRRDPALLAARSRSQLRKQHNGRHVAIAFSQMFRQPNQLLGRVLSRQESETSRPHVRVGRTWLCRGKWEAAQKTPSRPVPGTPKPPEK